MANKYIKESISYGQNDNIPKSLSAEKMLDDDLMNSVGLYSKEDVNKARFNNFSRFGRVLDPYGRVNAGREYLFFVKPDLHICAPDNNPYASIYKLTNTSSGYSKDEIYKSSSGLILNPQLNMHPYFKNLVDMHPDVVKQLQYSISSIGQNPFCYLLSSSVSSNLPLDSSTAQTMDTPATIFGTSYKYLQDSEASDEAYSFSLEFIDNKYLDTYSFFKAYSEYHIARKSGLVTPPSLNYYRYRRLHNTMGIYKFIVAEDMETILYWAYVWGVIPTSCPREAFQDPSFSDGLTFSVSFESAFIEDMNPMILYTFNSLMSKVVQNSGCSVDKPLSIVRTAVNSNISISGYNYNIGTTSFINGKLPVAALVHKYTTEERIKYRLKWYAP